MKQRRKSNLPVQIESLRGGTTTKVGLAVVTHPNGDKNMESILEFWQRQVHLGRYPLLSNVARVVFAVPASSAEIERDFGVAGMLVTTQRGSLGDDTIDMCTTISRNKDFVDLADCPKLTYSEATSSLPSNLKSAMEVEDAYARFTLDDHLSDAFSGCSEAEEETDVTSGVWM